VIHDGVLTVLSSLRPVTTGMVLVRVFEVPPFLFLEITLFQDVMTCVVKKCTNISEKCAVPASSGLPL